MVHKQGDRIQLNDFMVWDHIELIKNVFLAAGTAKLREMDMHYLLKINGRITAWMKLHQ
jgi:hypothetical protein